MGLRIGLENDLSYHSVVPRRTSGGGGWREVWPGLRSRMFDWGIRQTTSSLVKCLCEGQRWIILFCMACDKQERVTSFCFC